MVLQLQRLLEGQWKKGHLQDGLQHEHSQNSTFTGPSLFLTCPGWETLREKRTHHGHGWVKRETLVLWKGTEMVSCFSSPSSSQWVPRWNPSHSECCLKSYRTCHDLVLSHSDLNSSVFIFLLALLQPHWPPGGRGFSRTMTGLLTCYFCSLQTCSSTSQGPFPCSLIFYGLPWPASLKWYHSTIPQPFTCFIFLLGIYHHLTIRWSFVCISVYNIYKFRETKYFSLLFFFR